MTVDAKYGRPSAPLRVTSEKSDASWVCCGYCSIQMVARVVKPDINDNMSGAAHEARACCGRPHNNGSNSSETRNGIMEAEGVDVNACSTADIPDKLRAGKAVQFCCEYGALPSYVKTQGGSFGHSVCLYGWTDANGGCVGFYDPLYNQDGNGLWAKWSDIKGAGWGGDAHNVSVKTAPEPPKPPEPEPEPEVDMGYTQEQMDAAIQRALVSQDDALVAWWVAWFDAGPPKPQDAWDVGVWSDPLSRADVSGLLSDPCDEPIGEAASWARDTTPFPVAEAAEVRETPAVWGKTNWRESHWQ